MKEIKGIEFYEGAWGARQGEMAQRGAAFIQIRAQKPLEHNIPLPFQEDLRCQEFA